MNGHDLRPRPDPDRRSPEAVAGGDDGMHLPLLEVTPVVLEQQARDEIARRDLPVMRMAGYHQVDALLSRDTQLPANSFR